MKKVGVLATALVLLAAASAQWQRWTVPPSRSALKETVIEWTETWRDGSVWTGWTERGGKRSWFTAIECRN